MPPKRRSTSGSTGASNRQSTLTFHGRSNKISKPSKGPVGKPSVTSNTTPANKTKVDPLIAESIVRTNLRAASSPDISEPTTAEAALLEQVESEAARQAVERTKEEEEALKVTEAQIKKYWQAKESQRKAPRVHQEDLSLHEKVLREWDVSGHYGVSSIAKCLL